MGGDEIAEHVHGSIGEIHTEFHPRHATESMSLAGGEETVHPQHAIMVGERHRGEPGLHSLFHQFLGRGTPVGKRRMYMQVNHAKNHRRKIGGGYRGRTDDLLNAIQALYQTELIPQ